MPVIGNGPGWKDAGHLDISLDEKNEIVTKGILEFRLPDDRYWHEIAINAPRYVRAIGEFDEYLRRLIKWGEEKDQKLDVQEVRDKFWEFMMDADAIIPDEF